MTYIKFRVNLTIIGPRSPAITSIIYFRLVMGSPDKKCDDSEETEEDVEQLCLKLHRLGRTCFRKVS